MSAPLGEIIRAALVAGTLPLLEGDAFGSTARGRHDCACCGARIRPGTIQYQPRDHTALYAHMLCYILWRDETRRLRYEQGAAADA